MINYSCKNKISTRNDFIDSVTNKQIKFIHYLDSLGYYNFYQESKWKIYLKYCDQVIINDCYGNKIKNSRLFGETNLVLDNAGCYDDSLIGIHFIPVLNDSDEVKYHSFEDKNLRYTFHLSHFINKKNRLFYGYGLGDIGIKIDSLELNDYCNKIQNCNKKEFIEKNRKKFDKWFIEEALRRKFIDD